MVNIISTAKVMKKESIEFVIGETLLVFVFSSFMKTRLKDPLRGSKTYFRYLGTEIRTFLLSGTEIRTFLLRGQKSGHFRTKGHFTTVRAANGLRPQQPN